LTARLQKTALSEKMIEDYLSRVEESAVKSTYKLGIGFERCENMSERSAPKFISSSNYHKERKHSNQTKPTTHPIQSLPSTQKRNEERNPQAERGTFCMHVLWPCRSLR
jgi:hypothetical protein